MSWEASNAASLPHGEALRLLDDFKVCQAMDLARAGAYNSAELLIRPTLEGHNSPVAVLDLQARIYAQQGRLDEAFRWWQRVLEQEPANASAQAALVRLHNMQRRPIWVQIAWPLLVACGAIACLTLILLWQGRRQVAANAAHQEHVAQSIAGGSQTTARRLEALFGETKALESRLTSFLQNGTNRIDALKPIIKEELASAVAALTEQRAAFHADSALWAKQQETRAQALSSQLAELNQAILQQSNLQLNLNRQRAENEDLQSQNRALAASRESLLAHVKEVTNAPTVEINVPGVRATVSGRVLCLVFEDGLFDHGVHLKPGAESRLQSTAKALAQLTEPLKIEVVGYADDDRPFLNWTKSWESSLALKRATTVVRLFHSSTLLRPDDVSAGVESQGSRPFPSDSDVNRAKNRTVMLRITRVM